jgi:hypothetical protein
MPKKEKPMSTGSCRLSTAPGTDLFIHNDFIDSFRNSFALPINGTNYHRRRRWTTQRYHPIHNNQRPRNNLTDAYYARKVFVGSLVGTITK